MLESGASLPPPGHCSHSRALVSDMDTSCCGENKHHTSLSFKLSSVLGLSIDLDVLIYRFRQNVVRCILQCIYNEYAGYYPYPLYLASGLKLLNISCYIFIFRLNFRFNIVIVQKLPWVAGDEARRWTLVYSRPRLEIMRSVARLCWGRSMIAIMGFKIERWRKCGRRHNQIRLKCAQCSMQIPP